jgi:hypothetical protein
MQRFRRNGVAAMRPYLDVSATAHPTHHTPTLSNLKQPRYGTPNFNNSTSYGPGGRPWINGNNNNMNYNTSTYGMFILRLL